MNLLAANDPSSTYNIYQQLQPRIEDSPICIFLNTREDRRYRTNQLLNLIFTKIIPSVLIVRGEYLPSNFYTFQQENPEIKIHQLSPKADIKEMIAQFSNLENYFIVGMGNMLGWGENFVQDLKQYRI